MEIWDLIKNIVGWFVLPAIAFVISLSKQQEADRRYNSERHGDLEKQILRAMTILEERNKRRDEDRAEMASIMKELKDEIRHLGNKIEAAQGSPARRRTRESA